MILVVVSAKVILRSSSTTLRMACILRPVSSSKSRSRLLDLSEMFAPEKVADKSSSTAEEAFELDLKRAADVVCTVLLSCSAEIDDESIVLVCSSFAMCDSSWAIACCAEEIASQKDLCRFFHKSTSLLSFCNASSWLEDELVTGSRGSIDEMESVTEGGREIVRSSSFIGEFLAHVDATRDCFRLKGDGALSRKFIGRGLVPS
mmetsp:Transcript_43102/g.69976  ORF Transcript_43102/g.69976 Transcript_43102/m.69976 type:complete len:204 (-) Transcript_43102:973-1584(-)